MSNDIGPNHLRAKLVGQLSILRQGSDNVQRGTQEHQNPDNKSVGQFHCPDLELVGLLRRAKSPVKLVSIQGVYQIHHRSPTALSHDYPSGVQFQRDRVLLPGCHYQFTGGLRIQVVFGPCRKSNREKIVRGVLDILS